MFGVQKRFAPKAPMSPKPTSSHSTTTKLGGRAAALARAHGPTAATAKAAALRCRNDRRCILAPPTHRIGGTVRYLLADLVRLAKRGDEHDRPEARRPSGPQK